MGEAMDGVIRLSGLIKSILIAKYLLWANRFVRTVEPINPIGMVKHD